MTKIYHFKPRKKKFFKFKPRWPRAVGGWSILVLGLVGYLAVDLYAGRDISLADGEEGIFCSRPYIIDGDTLDCDGVRIRLAGIDTAEMEGHCRPGRKCTSGDPIAARKELVALTRGEVTCRKTDTDVYGRTVARCESEDEDLSCAMLESGYAVRRYGRISCL